MSLGQRTRVRPRSAKRAAEPYAEFVVDQLRRHPRCQVGPIIAKIDPLWRGCTGRSTELHHLRKLSSSGRRVSRLNTLASCNPCNAGWIEDEPDMAHAVGLAIRSCCPWWRWLGRRRPSGGRW